MRGRLYHLGYPGTWSPGQDSNLHCNRGLSLSLILSFHAGAAGATPRSSGESWVDQWTVSGSNR